MDFSSLFSPGSWPGSMLPQNQPGAVQPGGAMNILPPVAQSAPAPVVNPDGTQPQQPAQGLSQGQQFGLNTAMNMLKPPAAPPPMAPIQMVQPHGMGMLNQLGVIQPQPQATPAQPAQAARPFGWPPHIPGAF